MSDTELARSIRKALHDNDYINYNHENNKYIEWLILDILSEYKLLKKNEIIRKNKINMEGRYGDVNE